MLPNRDLIFDFLTQQFILLYTCFIYLFFIVKVIFIFLNNAVPLQVGALAGYDNIISQTELLIFFLAAGNDVINM